MAYDHRIKGAFENACDEFDAIPITNTALMCKYFDYPEIRAVLRNHPANITGILENDPMYDDILLEILDTPPKKLLQMPQYCACFPSEENEDSQESVPFPLRSVNLSSLKAFLENSWSKQAGELCSAVERVTYGGTAKLTCEQAYEVLVFCGLFGFVQHCPGESDENLLTGFMQLKPVIGDVLKQQKIILLNRTETTLPFCGSKHTGKAWQPDLAVIHNTLEETARVKLEDCCQQVHLEPGEKILALVREGSVVAFLPRFCVSDRQLILQEGGQVNVYQGEVLTDSLALEEDGPVLLAESHRYGLLMADRNGVFLKELLKNNFRGQAPEDPVFWLRGDLEDYGSLTGNGSYLGPYPRKNWKNLFFFDISAGEGIAVTQERKAIDADGRVLATDAAQVSCWADRWIVLRCDGSVITDRGEISKPDFPARAVCADDRGYWVATDNHLYRVGDGEETYDQSVEEIARSNDGHTVFGRMADGSYLPMR